MRSGVAYRYSCLPPWAQDGTVVAGSGPWKGQSHATDLSISFSVIVLAFIDICWNKGLVGDKIHCQCSTSINL